MIVADALAKGITEFDVATLYTGLRAQATTQVPHNARADIEAWVSDGFIPYSTDIKSAASLTLECVELPLRFFFLFFFFFSFFFFCVYSRSNPRRKCTHPLTHVHTLTHSRTTYTPQTRVTGTHSPHSSSPLSRYAYDDWALSHIATYLNETADAALFLSRSENYRNVWDPKSKFFCPRPLSNDSTPVFACPRFLNDGYDNYYQVRLSMTARSGLDCALCFCLLCVLCCVFMCLCLYVCVSMCRYVYVVAERVG